MFLLLRLHALAKHGPQVRRLAEAIKRLPGVTVNASGSIELRGLGNGYTQILLDGEKAPAGFTQDSLDPALIERIEIIRSATADLRTESIAGTINIILRGVSKTAERQVTIGLATASGRLAPSLGWQFSDQGETLSYGLNVAVMHREFLVRESADEIGTDAAGLQRVLRTSAWRVHGHQDQLTMTPAKLKLAGDDMLSFQGFALASRHLKYGDIRSQTLQGEPEPYGRLAEHTDTASRQLRGDLNCPILPPMPGQNAPVILSPIRREPRWPGPPKAKAAGVGGRNAQAKGLIHSSLERGCPGGSPPKGQGTVAAVGPQRTATESLR